MKRDAIPYDLTIKKRMLELHRDGYLVTLGGNSGVDGKRLAHFIRCRRAANGEATYPAMSEINGQEIEPKPASHSVADSSKSLSWPDFHS